MVPLPPWPGGTNVEGPPELLKALKKLTPQRVPSEAGGSWCRRYTCARIQQKTLGDLHVVPCFTCRSFYQSSGHQL